MSKDLVTPYSDRMTISDAINELAGRDIPEEVVFEGEVFTSSEKTKLGGIEAEATKNRKDSENANASHTHPISQVVGLTTELGTKVNKVDGKELSDTNFTQAEKTKLAGVAVAATANRVDSLNANKSHKHTVSDITGLNTVIEGLEARILALESAGG